MLHGYTRLKFFKIRFWEFLLLVSTPGDVATLPFGVDCRIDNSLRFSRNDAPRGDAHGDPVVHRPETKASPQNNGGPRALQSPRVQ